MRLLTHTNIVVDDFEMCKDYPPNTFIHFLTHFHADHWQGLTPLWNYGIIYCTEVTKRFILQKFPKILNIYTLEYNTPYFLDLISQKIVDKCLNKFVITVWVFDAHHIPGAAMYLFQGYMGTIFHTGDFRFNTKMITQNPILFPNEIVKKKYRSLWEDYQAERKDLNPEVLYNSFIETHHNLFKEIAIQVDEMIYDNTYCNKMFDFPKASVVSQQMIEIIKSNPNKRVYIAMGALGYLFTIYKSKEDICQALSMYFQTLIVVSQPKYLQMEASQCVDMKMFTTDTEKGWIEIVKRNREQDIKTNLKTFVPKAENYICISIDFLMLEHYNPDGVNFIVPYSLHSNYKEMENLVKCVCPAILKKLVIPFENFPEYRKNMRIHFLGRFKAYLKRLDQDGQSGYSYFIKNHTNFSKVSPIYLSWMHEGISNELMIKLKVDVEPSRKNRKRKANQVEKMGRGEKLRHLGKQFVFGKIQWEKQASLQQIADQLKGTNKNRTIIEYLTVKEQNELQQKSISKS